MRVCVWCRCVVCCVRCGVFPLGLCGCQRMQSGLSGDQTTCVPTLASMGTRGFESWSIIWGKKNCITSPRGMGGAGSVFEQAASTMHATGPLDARLIGRCRCSTCEKQEGCHETGLQKSEVWREYACSVGAVGHLCFIFNSVSKSEAELNMVFVIRCGLGDGAGWGTRVCDCGDQTTCVPTLASMGTRGFESWSIIWGKKNCIISPRCEAVCRAGGIWARRGGGVMWYGARLGLVISSVEIEAPHSDSLVRRCDRVTGGHNEGCDPGSRCVREAR